MKASCERIATLIVLALAMAPMTAACEDSLRLVWGLEKPMLYREIEATAAQNAAIWPPAEEGDEVYRYFTIRGQDSSYYEAASEIAERHFRLWDQFLGDRPDVEDVRKEYLSYARTNDPYLLGAINAVAPVLYFDFIGGSKTEYILTRIVIQTIAFDEYLGGGFFNDTAWYDIELGHSPGVRVYDVNRKLRFTGSGRAELRFWSDNYYPNVGLSPMGCYTIAIQFYFLADGEEIVVSTGVFKIDV